MSGAERKDSRPYCEEEEDMFQSAPSLSYLHSLNNTILKKCTSWERYFKSLRRMRQYQIVTIVYVILNRLTLIVGDVIRPQAKNSRKMTTVA